MQVPGPFEYERATSVDHAIGLLDRLGDGALVVAGGHSLLPMMKLRIANPEYLVDINDLAAELGYIIVEPTRVRIGAMARHRAGAGVRRARRGVPDLPRRRAGDRRSRGAQPRNRRRIAVPGGSGRGPDDGVRGARRSLRGPWAVGVARDLHRRLPGRPLRDVARAQRDARRGAYPAAAQHLQCLRQGGTAGRRLGRDCGGRLGDRRRTAPSRPRGSG